MDSLSVQGEAGVGRLFKAAGVMDEATTFVLDHDTESVAEAFLAVASAALVNVPEAEDDTFIVDSGASHHMVKNKHLVRDIVPSPIKAVEIGDGTRLPVIGEGNLTIDCLVFHHVLVVPTLSANLLSTKCIPDHMHWRLTNRLATLYLADGTAVIRAKVKNGLYYTKASRPLASALLSSPADSVRFWHDRLGHLNVRDVRRLATTGRLGEENRNMASEHEYTSFVCEHCIRGKTTRLPSPPSDTRAARPLEVLQDLWGEARTVSRGGAKYYVIVHDDYTRLIHITPLKLKSDAFEAVKAFITMAENRLEHRVKTIRSDNGGEFDNGRFKDYTASRGILHHMVPADAHAQNGRVERGNLTIANGIRTILHQTGWSKDWWAEIARYVAFSRNCSPSGPRAEIPFELWYGKKLRMDPLYAFGQKIFYRDHRESDKLETRYKEGRFLGYAYDDTTLTYRIRDSQGLVRISRDVVFDKDAVIPTINVSLGNLWKPLQRTDKYRGQLTCQRRRFLYPYNHQLQLSKKYTTRRSQINRGGLDGRWRKTLATIAKRPPHRNSRKPRRSLLHQ